MIIIEAEYIHSTLKASINCPATGFSIFFNSSILFIIFYEVVRATLQASLKRLLNDASIK